ncbi:MAG: hypothetical protein AB7S26_13575 [Sandaracinaceae bacterium]
MKLSGEVLRAVRGLGGAALVAGTLIGCGASGTSGQTSSAKPTNTGSAVVIQAEEPVTEDVAYTETQVGTEDEGYESQPEVDLESVPPPCGRG